jgi:predicted nucleic acid-binding protein
MLYLDTSLLVAVLTNGAETERMQHWLEQQPVDDLALSDWVATEFSSALSIKLRTGQIGAAHRADALATSHGSPRTALPSFRSRGCSFGRLRDSRTNIRWACALEVPSISPSAPAWARRSTRSSNG